MSLRIGQTMRMEGNAIEPHIASLTFAPWKGMADASCRTCRDSVGWFEWLICRRTGLAPNGYPCHAWERAPGADDR